MEKKLSKTHKALLFLTLPSPSQPDRARANLGFLPAVLPPLADEVPVKFGR
jgi:hypothetical protein